MPDDIVDEPIDTPDPIADVRNTLHDVQTRLGALEEKIVAAPAAVVAHVEPIIEPAIDEPPAVFVESTVERSPLRKIHDALG